MGTHGAFGFIINDQLKAVERTLDGHNVIELQKHMPPINALLSWARSIYEDHPNAVGRGAIEYDVDREHEQEFYLLIDFDHRAIYSNIVQTALARYVTESGWELNEEPIPRLVERFFYAPYETDELFEE